MDLRSGHKFESKWGCEFEVVEGGGNANPAGAKAQDLSTHGPCNYADVRRPINPHTRRMSTAPTMLAMKPAP
jgi:hypothetical protein